MSDLHLAVGSTEPPRINGLLRLYSAKVCPYAHRSRLVLNAKGIPYDIVNINLFRKPEWYFDRNPKGLVPTLLDGDKIVVESLDICDYLEEKYRNNPLYPSDPELKKRDKILIQKMDTIVLLFFKSLWGREEKTVKEWAAEFIDALKDFEDELAKRGTVFFGGNKPGMVDYMLWPWAERSECVDLKFGAKLPLKHDDLPLMCKWKKAMQEYPVCAAIYNTPESFWKIAKLKTLGVEPDYDEGTMI